MPLVPGKSQAAISANIRELHEANKSKPKGKKRSRQQIIAIALANARRHPSPDGYDRKQYRPPK